MPTYEKREDYLLVEVREPYSFDFYMSAMHEISARCRAENLKKALIDLRQSSGSPGILDRYELGVEIARVWGPHIKAVVVFKRNLVNYMTENVAVNRGARFKVVSEMSDALEWLGEN